MATNSCVWTGSNLTPWTAPNTGSWVHVQQGGLTPAPNKWCDGAGHGLMDCTATVAGTLASMVQAPGVNIVQPVEANITFQRSAVCATAGTQWIECGLIICADSDQNPQNFVAVKTIELSDGGKQPAQKYCVAMYTVQSGIWSQWIITATIADLSGTFRNWIIKARIIGLPDNSAILQMKGYNPAQTTEPGWVSSGGSTATYSFTYATTLGPTYSSAWAGNRYGIFTGWYTTGAEYYALYSNYNINNVTVTNLVVANSSHGTTVDNISIAAGGTTLVVQNSTHATLAGAEVLTQVHNLTVANASHAQVSQSTSPSYNLVVANSSHAQVAGAIVLQRIHNLVVQGTSHATLSDNVVLARIHNLEIHSSVHAVPTDGAIVLDQHVGVFDLVVQDVTHDVTSQNVAITQLHILVVSDTQHQTFVGSIVIPQIHILEIVTNSHATKTDEVSFTQLHILVVDAGLEAVLSENTALVQLHILEIQSPSHSEFVQTCALQVQGSITPFESAHVVKSTNVTLVQNYSLDVQSSSHDISNTIPPIGPVLLVQGATQTTAAQRIDVTQTHHISVTDSKLVTATQNLALTGTAVLDVSDSYQTVESSSSTLSQLHHLVIGSTAHLISSESKNLIQTHILTAANTNHCVTSLNVRFTAGAPKIWLGVSWESKFVKVYRGNDIWNDVFMYRWTGNEWVTV